MSILLLSSLYSTINGQSLRLKAGFSSSSNVVMINNESYSSNFKKNSGFHIGASIDLPLVNFLSFEPGLMYTTKGNRIESESYGNSYKSKFNLAYLQTNLNLKAIKNLKGALKIYVAAGPYFAYALHGTNTQTTTENGITTSVSKDIKFSTKDNDKPNPIDLEVELGGGFEYNSFLLEMGYDIGLKDISNDNSSNSSVKNRLLRVSLGYMF